MSVIRFWAAHRFEVGQALIVHVLLVAAATAAATIVGVSIGILAARRPRISSPLVSIASVFQTVPSLAMFGFLLPLPLVGGVGAKAAVTALILYGLLPIVRTTIAGFAGIDASVREAATAMGMSSYELLRDIDLPLAMPSIVAGIRVAAVTGVGSATIAAAIGAGGLGEFIYRGLSMVDSTVILAGAIPASCLALAVDGGLWWVGRWLAPRRQARSRFVPALVAALLITALLGVGVFAIRSGSRITVGSKNTTEQIILGELLAQTIERSTGFIVDRRLNLGGTLICDRALATGDIDVYVEYTGTALTAIFGKPVVTDPKQALDTVRDEYARTSRSLLPALGFNNSFAILVRGQDARARNLRTIEDAAREAPRWHAGFGYEFLQRPDGYDGLARTYGLRFAEPPRAMDLTLTYRALASGQVDLIAGDATAGLIHSLDLVQLDDNRLYFPPYDAVPVARSDTLLRYPEVREAILKLAGRISARDMQAMNAAVDGREKDPAAAARDFLNANVPDLPQVSERTQ
jgi:osmoprotectant transport system substrate-binding protein/osmoprotectant transport system permease protein